MQSTVEKVQCAVNDMTFWSYQSAGALYIAHRYDAPALQFTMDELDAVHPGYRKALDLLLQEGPSAMEYTCLQSHIEHWEHPGPVFMMDELSVPLYIKRCQKIGADKDAQGIDVHVHAYTVRKLQNVELVASEYFRIIYFHWSWLEQHYPGCRLRYALVQPMDISAADRAHYTFHVQTLPGQLPALPVLDYRV